MVHPVDYARPEAPDAGPPMSREERTLQRREVLRRSFWLIAGLVLIAFAIFEVAAHDLGPWPIIVFALLPDFAFVAGVGQPHQRGQLPPRAVPLYNLAHGLALPLTLTTLALIALIAVKALVTDPGQLQAARNAPLVAYVAGITWVAHIAIDRAIGFGLRTPDGWQRTA
jgi:hypothetical protein